MEDLEAIACTVHESGLMEQGGLYVVSEHIDGQPWQEFIANTKLDQLKRLAIAEQLIKTMHAFHEKQLHHGDLCPDKILMQLRTSDYQPHRFS